MKALVEPLKVEKNSKYETHLPIKGNEQTLEKAKTKISTLQRRDHNHDFVIVAKCDNGTDTEGWALKRL